MATGAATGEELHHGYNNLDFFFLSHSVAAGGDEAFHLRFNFSEKSGIIEFLFHFMFL